MLGIIIGDVIESRFITDMYRSYDFDLFDDDCFFTCNSIMGFTIVQSLLDSKELIKSDINNDGFTVIFENIFRKNLCECRMKYPKFSLNLERKETCDLKNQGAKWISPLAHFVDSESDLMNLIEIISKILETDYTSIIGVKAVGLAIYLAKNHNNKVEIRKTIEDRIYHCNLESKELASANEVIALKAFFDTNNFEEAIRLSVSLGNDQMSIAVITTSLAATFYGVADDVKQIGLSYLNDNLLKLFKKWEDNN